MFLQSSTIVWNCCWNASNCSNDTLFKSVPLRKKGCFNAAVADAFATAAVVELLEIQVSSEDDDISQLAILN
jgi:hypothetical protein